MSEQSLDNREEHQQQARSKLLILVLAFSVLLSGVTVDMVTPVLGVIGLELNGSESQISWVVTGVTLVLAISIPFYGRLSDSIEARKLFTIGVLILTLGSFISALSSNLLVLVLGRMIQGAGMASISVVSIVVVSRVYPPGQRGAVLGIIAGSIGIGTAGGPIFGGLVGEAFGWQSLFWITFVLGLCIVIGAQVSMPQIKPVEHKEKRNFDVVGGISLGLTIGFFLLGVTLAETSGLRAFTTISSLLLSFLACIALIFQVKTKKDPFIPRPLLRNNLYTRSVLLIFLSMFVYFPILVFVPMLVVEVNEWTPGEAGLLLLPGGGTVAILSPIVGRLSDRISHKYFLGLGLAIMAVSTALLSIFAGNDPIFLTIGVFGSGVAYALINSPANNFAVSTLNKEQVGVGMGLFQGAMFLGTGAGASIVGAFLSAREDTAHALNPVYQLNAPHYSDIFFAITLISIIAFIVAMTLPKQQQKNN